MTTATTLPKRSEIPVEFTWNLATIYPTDTAWEQDFARVTALLPQIRSFQGRIGETGAAMLDAFKVRDDAGETLGRLFVYAHMRMHEDTANSTYQALADRVTTLASDLSTAASYIKPELLALPWERIEQFLQETPDLHVYRHELDEVN